MFPKETVQKGKIMNRNDLTITALYDLSQTMAADLLAKYTYPWEALAEIGSFILELGSTLSEEEYELRGENVWVHKTASVAANACIQGPTIIGKEAEIRPCAYIRGKALVGEGAVIGNSCELKNAIIFNKAQIPHFNYVGDSVIGYKAHMGGGSMTSNLKSDKSLVVIKTDEEQIETGLKKVGAMLGDYAEVGAGAVMNPGTVVGRNANIYPLSMVRGTIPANSIYKKAGEIVAKR